MPDVDMTKKMAWAKAYARRMLPTLRKMYALDDDELLEHATVACAVMLAGIEMEQQVRISGAMSSNAAVAYSARSL
jgi:hypothetical protein